MTQPNPESQTPPAKVLLPLGAVIIILSIACMVLMDLGPVSTVMGFVLIVMGAGLIWQGLKNLKRDKESS